MSSLGRTIGIPVALLPIVLAGCGADRLLAPRQIDIVLDYGGPTGIVVPPATDVMCPHHYAPISLSLVTDWGLSAALQPASAPGHYGLVLQGVTTAAEHWVSVYDIQLCGLDPNSAPIATTGVTLNGVTLTRQMTTPAGVRALAFTVDASGGIHP